MCNKFINVSSGNKTWQRIKSVLCKIQQIFVAFFFVIVLGHIMKPFIKYFINNEFYKKLNTLNASFTLIPRLIGSNVNTIIDVLRGKELMRGEKIPNDLKVYTINGEEKQLSSIMDTSKVSVFNFGSCS